MAKPKGGRGNKAPYETKLMRVPEPLATQVESLCQRYQDFLAGGGNPIEPPYFLIDLPKITEQLQSELSNLKIENEALSEPKTQPIMEMVGDDCPIEPSNDSGDFRKLLEYALKATPDNIKELAGELIKDAQKAIADKDTREARNIRRKLKTDRKFGETHLNPSSFVYALTSAEHEIWLSFHEKQPNYSFKQAYQDVVEVEQFKKTQTRKIFKLGLTNSDYREYKNLAGIDR